MKFINLFQKRKSITISILVFLVLLPVFIYSYQIKFNKTQNGFDEDKLYQADAACEKTYNEPTEIVWDGEVIALFTSGVDYGIKKIPEDEKYPYFYAGRTEEEFDRVWKEKKEVGLQGKVRVKGKWVGVTAAYKNSVFGRCVPQVVIDSIEKIKAVPLVTNTPTLAL